MSPGRIDAVGQSCRSISGATGFDRAGRRSRGAVAARHLVVVCTTRAGLVRLPAEATHDIEVLGHPHAPSHGELLITEQDSIRYIDAEKVAATLRGTGA